MTGWVKIKKAAEYAGMSERTVRAWLKAGLKHARLPGGAVLIKIQWVDEFLEGFTEKDNEVDQIVADTLKGMRR